MVSMLMCVPVRLATLEPHVTLVSTRLCVCVCVCVSACVCVWGGGTMKVALLCQVSHYVRVKKSISIESWAQQGGLVVGGICYVRPLYDEVPLCIYSLTSGM